jgi:hypothetical protein
MEKQKTVNPPHQLASRSTDTRPKLTSPCGSKRFVRDAPSANTVLALWPFEAVLGSFILFIQFNKRQFFFL